MPSDTNLAYIAGLFDGEGCVSYKQYDRKRPHNKRAYPTWSIRLEISMTDQSVLKWIHEILKVGTVNPKRYKTKYTLGWKKQWRWRCQHREAYYVARLLWPYAHVKLDKIQKIIDHYSSKLEIMNDKVVSLEEYKQAMSLE
jgi:intein/homing endonuclease|tara:strand:+ start:1645 stop:2067 length:423 start_codon:yes stop_codon:yes gene_type:complete